MFIILSKLLPLFVYPLGLASIMLLAALLSRRDSRATKILITTALIILWLCSTTGFSNFLARSLEWQYTPSSDIPTAQVIVLLGGGTEPAVAPRPAAEVNGAGDRVLYAARLYKEGKAPLILLSGGNITWQNGGATTPAEDMAEIMDLLSVPAEALLLEIESLNTYENAVMAWEILVERDINRILLVTSAMHMPRSVGVFEKQGFEVIPAPVDYSVTEEEPAENGTNGIAGKLLDVIPQASALSLTTNAVKEYIGMLVYKIQGWM